MPAKGRKRKGTWNNGEWKEIRVQGGGIGIGILYA